MDLYIGVEFAEDGTDVFNRTVNENDITAEIFLNRHMALVRQFNQISQFRMNGLICHILCGFHGRRIKKNTRLQRPHERTIFLRHLYRFL